MKFYFLWNEKRYKPSKYSFKLLLTLTPDTPDIFSGKFLPKNSKNISGISQDTPDIFSKEQPLESYSAFTRTQSYEEIIQNQINELLTNYWFWPEILASIFTTQHKSNELSLPLVIKQQNRIIKARKRNKLLRSRNTKQSLECLELLLRNLSDNGQFVIKRANKSKTKPVTSNSTRRSSYNQTFKL